MKISKLYSESKFWSNWIYNSILDRHKYNTIHYDGIFRISIFHSPHLTSLRHIATVHVDSDRRTIFSGKLKRKNGKVKKKIRSATQKLGNFWRLCARQDFINNVPTAQIKAERAGLSNIFVYGCLIFVSVLIKISERRYFENIPNWFGSFRSLAE